MNIVIKVLNNQFVIPQINFGAKKKERNIAIPTSLNDCFIKTTNTNPMLKFFSDDMPEELKENCTFPYSYCPPKNLDLRVYFNDYMAFFNNKYKDKVDYMLDKPVEDFFKSMILFKTKQRGEEPIIQKLQSGGINSTLDLKEFLYYMKRILSDYTNLETRDYFKDKNNHTDYFKAFNIYSTLINKPDIFLYPQLLIADYDSTKDKEKFDPNQMTATLYLIGCNHEYDIDKRLSHLKKYFNNFNSVDDKLNAAKYITKTCNSKLQQINNVLITSGNKNGKITANDIYMRNTALIDKLYIKNKGNITDELSKIINDLSAPYRNKNISYNPRHNSRISNYYFNLNIDKDIKDWVISSHHTSEKEKMQIVTDYEEKVLNNQNNAKGKTAQASILDSIIFRNEPQEVAITWQFQNKNMFSTTIHADRDIQNRTFSTYNTNFNPTLHNINNSSKSSEFKKLSEEFKEYTISRILYHTNNERVLNDYLTCFNSNYSDVARNTPIDLFNHFIITVQKKDFNFLIRLNNNLMRNGIKTTYDLKEFLKIFNQNDANKNFYLQNIEALEIYSKLDDKKDLAKYPKFLLELYNVKGDDKNFNPNEYLTFIKNIKVNNLNDLEEKFPHLKNKFNDFETLPDKIAALDYLKSTHDDKIKFLKTSFEKLPKAKRNVNAEKIYIDNAGLIDTLYEKNSKKSITPLNTRIDLLTDYNKLNINHSIIKEHFNGLKTTDEKIKLFDFIAKNNLTIDDINLMPNKESILLNNNSLQNLTNKNIIVREIAKIKNIKPDEAKKLFEQYTDFYCAIYNNGKFKAKDFDNLSKCIKSFGIQNNSLLKIYNDINKTNDKQITSYKFRELIRLLTLLKDKSGVNNQKKLQNEIEMFNKTQPLIKEAVNFDIHSGTNLFEGKPLFEIYVENRDEISKNPSILTDKIQNSDKCIDKIGFYNLFKNSEKTYDFLSNNDIKSNSDDEEEKQFANCCFSILKNIKNDKKLLEYYENANFFGLSKNLLTTKYDVTFFTKDILKLIADKKISSLNDIDKFTEKYKDENGNYENIIKSIENSPVEVDFKNFENIINGIEQKLKTANINFVKIDNSNILNINIEAFKSLDDFNETKLPYILNNIMNPKNGTNFITELKKSLTDKQKSYSPYCISDELTKKQDEDKSYTNIFKILKLDKETLEMKESENYSDLTRRIEDVLPKEFIDFVNDDSYLKIGNKTANLTLHARLRLIERFGFNKINSMEELYSKKNKEYLNDIVKSIYTDTPKSVEGQDNDKVKIINSELGAVLSNDGKIITIINYL